MSTMLGDLLIGSAAVGGDAGAPGATDALLASVAAGATVTGQLSLSPASLSAAVQGAATASGNFGVLRDLAGAAFGQASVSGDLVMVDIVGLAAAVTGSAHASGTASITRFVNGRPLNLRRGAVTFQPISI